jgi:drug/metabolite transporter (DMT)-like permease
LTGQLKDLFQLHFIILLWGFTAILGLLIKIPAFDLVFYRTLLASAGLIVIIFIGKFRFNVGRKDFLKLAGTGVLVAGHWILFFESARVSTASISLAGLSTISFWTSLLEPIMKKQKIQWLELLLGILVIFGLYLIFHFEFGFAVGMIMSLVSAFFGAVFTVINSKITHRHNEYVITFYEMVAASLTTALFIIIYSLFFLSDRHLFVLPSALDWFYLALLAFVCTVYPYSVSVELMKRISAFMMNLSVNLEPVYGIILAVIIFGEKEKMNSGFYMGTAVILLSVIIYPVLRRRQRKWKLAVGSK